MEIEEDVKTLKDYLQIARRRKYHIAIPMLVLFALSILIALVLPPIYRSEAKILIEQQHIPTSLVKSTVASYADERIQKIQQKIMRIDNINKIIKEFGLYEGQQHQLSPTELAEIFSRNVLLNLISADVISQGRQSKATLAFNLSFDNNDPTVAKNVANKLVTLFLDENARSRTERAKETTTFLREEAEKYNLQIQLLENKLAQYKSQNSGSLPDLLPVSLSSVTRIESELQQVRLQEKMVNERKSSLRSQLAMTAPIFRSPNVDRQSVPNNLPALKAEYTRLRGKYSESHPDVKSINRKIANFKAPKKSSGKNDSSINNPIYLQLLNELKMADAEIVNLKVLRGELTGSLKKLELNISKTHQVERGYNDLIRDLDGQKEKYKELKAKFMDAKLAQTLEEEQKAEKFSILEPPRIPSKPEKPNRLKIIFMGLVFSLVGGLGTGYIVEIMDSSIRGHKELARITGIEPLVVIPYIYNDEDHAASKKNKINFLVIGLIVSFVVLIAIHFLYMHIDLIFFKILHKFNLLTI